MVSDGLLIVLSNRRYGMLFKSKTGRLNRFQTASAFFIARNRAYSSSSSLRITSSGRWLWRITVSAKLPISKCIRPVRP